jgi:hypothetical protein
MPGDYSRFSFDRRDRFAGVRMQQGRVQLDSDWNEQLDILAERTRLLTLDSGGTVWVPWAVTPDAFLVGMPGGAPVDFTLGEGRLYVDGRLAEIFPGEAVTYLNQPFWPEPDPYNPAADAIVYLDLWEREVTWVEDPGLLDVALGGVDTTTRVQQVWQVKIAVPPAGAGATCGTDLDAMFPPSAGRLTTSAVAPPAPDDPCILPPNAGYRGIENRLYRVEIQVGGPLGTAMFKWSRDDGSIVSQVGAIAVAGGQSRITVNRIGRDKTLRFRIGDWVTLTDDHRELHGEAGQMARIVDIDEAARVITLDRAVPTAGRAFGATAADLVARHTRLQRWDESAPLNALDGDGLMITAAGPIELEDGVLVSFSADPAAGDFHIGDYWVFAARTADASVEALNQAPPRGIIHHYAQIAAIPAGGAPSDCRPKPPVGTEKGCCTFVVAPGEDIQAAIDALPAAGGCVCLKAGLHLIDKPLLIRNDDVTLHGESQGAIVYNRRGTSLLVIAGAERVRVHDIQFRQGEEPSGQPAIFLERTREIAICDCAIDVRSPVRSIGVLVVASTSVALGKLRIAKPATGIWMSKGCGAITIDGCEISLPGAETQAGGSIAILADALSQFVTVIDNVIDQAVHGIVIDDDPAGMPVSDGSFSRVAGNRIVLARGNQKVRAFGIDMAADRSTVADNSVEHQGGNVTGIRIAGEASSATGNRVRSNAKEVSAELAIALGWEDGGKFVALNRASACDNVIEGVQHGIAATHLAIGRITGNVIGGGEARTGFGIVLASVQDCLVEDNVVIRPMLGVGAMEGARNTIRGNRIETGQIGIVVGKEEAPVITANRVLGVDQFAIVVAGATQRCDLIENHVVRCGAQSDAAVAIGAALVFGTCHIEANEVIDTGIDKSGKSIAPTAHGIVAVLVQEARVEANRVGYADYSARPPAAEDRALLMMGLWEIDVLFGNARQTLGSPVQIADNSFSGTGGSALVEVREIVGAAGSTQIFLRFERVQFGGNFCWHIVAPQFDAKIAATVSLVGRAFTIGNNQVKATQPKMASWHLHDRPGPFVANISAGPTLGRTAANQFPAPQAAFNMIS